MSSGSSGSSTSSSSGVLWSHDLKQLWIDGSWKNFLPWKEDESGAERSNAIARLIIYVTLLTYTLRQNPTYLQTGAAALFALAVLQPPPVESQASDAPPVEGADDNGDLVAGEQEGQNGRVNTEFKRDERLNERMRTGARQGQNRYPKVPTRDQEVYGYRLARKSVSLDDSDDSLFAPNRTGSARWESRGGKY